jgi:hypothetical protein
MKRTQNCIFPDVTPESRIYKIIFRSDKMQSKKI